jgi:hypothetical protein
MEDVGKFYGHFVFLWPFGILCIRLVYFVAIWYNLWPIGIICIFVSRFGMLY